MNIMTDTYYWTMTDEQLCRRDECKYRPVYKSEYFARILQSGQSFEWHHKAALQRQGRLPPPPLGGGIQGVPQSQV